MRKFLDKKVVSWALYDWANSAFATTVLAGFFPVFFKEYWSAGTAATTSTFYLGLAHTTSGLLIALLAPLLGTLADQSGGKTRFLLGFTLLGVCASAALAFVVQGAWFAALVTFVLSTAGFFGANIFYDSLLPDVAPRKKTHVVSALGFSLGYLGGGLLLAFNIAAVLHPQAFGLADSAHAVRAAFIIVAVWWAVFSVPLFLFVKEPRARQRPAWGRLLMQSLRELGHTFHEVRKLRPVFLFLAAYWLYIDGVGTVILMAVDYGIALGFDSGQLLSALLLTQFVAFPAALAFGKIGERWGAKSGIFIAIAVYFVAILWAMDMQHSRDFYGLAATIGLVQGGIQSLSRSFYACLIPRAKAGQFFGFYNMIGKFAAVLGPTLMGAVSVATGSSRLSLLALLALFAAGALVLYFVDGRAARAPD